MLSSPCIVRCLVWQDIFDDDKTVFDLDRKAIGSSISRPFDSCDPACKFERDYFKETLFLKIP